MVDNGIRKQCCGGILETAKVWRLLCFISSARQKKHRCKLSNQSECQEDILSSWADQKPLRSSCFSWTARGAGAEALCLSGRWPQASEEGAARPPPRPPTPGTGAAEARVTGGTGASRGASAPPAATSPGGAARVGLSPARLRTITTRHQSYRQAALAQGHRGRQSQGKVCRVW